MARFSSNESSAGRSHCSWLRLPMTSVIRRRKSRSRFDGHVAEHAGLAARRVEEAGEHLQRRRLAGAVRARGSRRSRPGAISNEMPSTARTSRVLRRTRLFVAASETRPRARGRRRSCAGRRRGLRAPLIPTSSASRAASRSARRGAKTQSPSGIETAPMTSSGQISSHSAVRRCTLEDRLADPVERVRRRRDRRDPLHPLRAAPRPGSRRRRRRAGCPARRSRAASPSPAR